jgi:hypothetical protein
VDPRLPRLPVANATFITSQLLVGGDLEVFNHDLATEQLDELVTAGVTDIVDLRLEWNDASWVLEQMPHLRYSIWAWTTPVNGCATPGSTPAPTWS